MVRNVGDPLRGARLIEPTIEDGYLLLIGSSAHDPRAEPAA
jgi:ABC-2 type transport system ATP-binding protein